MNEIEVLDVQTKIYNVRNIQVMLDSDLAYLYGVETRVFNQAIKRNIERFPENFRFQLTEKEYESLRSQIVTLKIHQGRGMHKKYLPYVFTEQGVSMLSAVLKSKTAIETSIKIINSFVNMRKFISTNASIFQRLDNIEEKQLKYQIQTDEKFDKIFEAMQERDLTPKQGIFFDGQIYDAYVFINDLIKKAKKSIILIDNYIDENTLLLFSNSQTLVTIYTKVSKKTTLDLKKYNAQYSNITIKNFTNSHDRFLILDDKIVYHVGASLKDLGKKWFAFSKMDIKNLDIIGKLP